jgi:hypothetical protein
VQISIWHTYILTFWSELLNWFNMKLYRNSLIVQELIWSAPNSTAYFNLNSTRPANMGSSLILCAHRWLYPPCDHNVTNYNQNRVQLLFCEKHHVYYIFSSFGPFLRTFVCADKLKIYHTKRTLRPVHLLCPQFWGAVDLKVVCGHTYRISTRTRCTKTWSKHFWGKPCSRVLASCTSRSKISDQCLAWCRCDSTVAYRYVQYSLYKLF